MSIKYDLDKNYVLVSFSDVFQCMKCLKEDDPLYQECRKIFCTFDMEDNCFRLPSFHPIVLWLKKKKEDKYYIDASSLKDAIAIAISENNNEMQKTLTRYFKKYMDHERNGVSNADLISEIILDEQTITFIKKYLDFETYENELVQKSYNKIQKQIRLLRENLVRGAAML